VRRADWKAGGLEVKQHPQREKGAKMKFMIDRIVEFRASGLPHPWRGPLLQFRPAGAPHCLRARRTSRVLNDDSYLLGLSYGDISGAGIFLLVLLFAGKALKFDSQLWALMLSVAVLGVMIPVRMKFRRKIIRDGVIYLILKDKVYVKKDYR
jgi:hypothetical protein